MKRKLVSMLLVLVMLVSLFPAMMVSAATTITDGWYIQELKNGTGNATCTVEVADVGYQSGHSLYINMTSDDTGKNWLNIENDGMQSYTASDRYTVSFRIKKVDTTGSYPDILFGFNGDPTKPVNRLESRQTGYVIGEADDNGWQLVTASTTADATRFFRLNIQKTSFEAYIDDFVVIKNGESTNLLENGDFEPEESVTIPTHTSLDALEDWSAKYRSGYPETSGTREIKTATGVAYTGEKSMYAKSDSNAHWIEISNSALTSALDSSKTYDVSFYITGTYTAESNEFSVKMGNTFADKSSTPSAYTAKSMTFVDPENSEKIAEGWKKVSVTLHNPDSAFLFVVQGACEVYIDDFSVVETGTDTNLLANPGFEGGPVVLPDITEKALDTTKWNVSAGNIGTGTYTAGITAMEAQQGKKSLHVTWSATGSGYVQLQAKMNVLTDNETYTLKAHVKRISGNAAKIGSWKDWGGTGVGNTAEGQWEEMTIKEACVGGPKIVQIILEGTAGVDMYVDNMVLTDSTGAVVWSEDFETATTGFETSAIKLFDEDMNEITALSSEHNGKTVTGAVAITNYDKADLTGQLMFALYDGYQLEELIMSEVQNVEITAGGAAIVTVDFELPDYKDSYTMKAFIWDSIEGMNPLSRKVVEF